jgi:hypothetical protein
MDSNKEEDAVKFAINGIVAIALIDFLKDVDASSCVKLR